MKASVFRDSFEGMRSERTASRLLVLLLAMALLVCLFLLASRSETIIQIPPGLTEAGEVSVSTANAPVKEAWSTHVAQLLGNVTPRNADFVATALGKMAAPSVYKDLMAAVENQARMIKDEQVTIQFAPTSVFWVPDGDYTAVTGEYIVRGVRDSTSRMVRTYEVGLVVRNYMVSMTSLDVYEGPWRPRASREKAQAKAAQKQSKS